MSLRKMKKENLCVLPKLLKISKMAAGIRRTFENLEKYWYPQGPTIILFGETLDSQFHQPNLFAS